MDLEELQKVIESRTNTMLKIIFDILTKQSDKSAESLTAHSDVIGNFMDKMGGVST